MHGIISTSTTMTTEDGMQDDNCQVRRIHLLGTHDNNNPHSNHNRWLSAGAPKLEDITTKPKTTTQTTPTTYSPSKILQRHDSRWRRRRRRNLSEEIRATSTYQPPVPPQMLLPRILATGCYLLLLTLILVLNTPATTSIAGVSATSVVTGSNLAAERIHIIRQPASNLGGSHKQTSKYFKEIFEKFVIHVKENTPIGTKLADVQPRDQDTSSNPLLGHLGQQQHPFANEETLYKIMPNDDANLFTIRKDEHKIELVNEVAFDYESPKKSYNVLIRATSIYFRYELEVDILVEDENDNRPQLDDFAIVFNNYKNHFPTGPIGRVPATDADVSDSLRFRALSGNNAQLIIVNETNGDIQLSPELDSNVPLRAVMDIAVSDGINEAVAKLVLTVNLVTEAMLHNSVTLRLDGMTREDFLTRKYDLFLNELAKILGTSRAYSTTDIVVFDVEESHLSLDQQRTPAAAAAAAAAQSPVGNGEPLAGASTGPAAGVGYRTAYNSVHITNASQTYVNVSFSARADGHDVEAYLSRQYIEERIYLHRLLLAQALEAQVAPFQDDACVQEPCQNYQECHVTHRFDRAPKLFITERNMIFRQIKAAPSHTCLCPATFTGMRNKLECNLQINQCYTNPCLNRGQCHRHESGYTCQCRGEFFGARCEHSFLNSTCQSISMPAVSSSSISMVSGNLIQVDVAPDTTSGKLALASSGGGISQAATTASLCSGKSRCQNLNKFHQQYYQKFATQSGASASVANSPTSSNSPPGGFTCQGCSYPSQWTNSLCQLRARSFERQTYVSLPSLRRRHRFHLMLQFVTVEQEALLLYNGRYNDRHDFIALEIVDSHLRLSYSLGGSTAQDVQRVSLPSVPVSDGEWHRVTIDYRDRNVTLMVDDCDPVLDEASARYQLANAGGSMPRRCSNTTTTSGSLPQFDSTGGSHNMLDLTSPMQLGALPINLIAATSSLLATTTPFDLLTAAGAANNDQQQLLHPPAWSHLANMGANSFTGCMSDLYIDHRLVDLSTPLQDYGTQPGCSDKRTFCQPGTCQGGQPCQESFGAARCQCGEERLGRACELHLSQEKVRKFSGNSYLTFNPIEARIPHTWQVSLHFRSINPNGVLFKVLLDSDTSILLELHNGGLRLSYRTRHLTFTKLALDDGEWHFVELTWTGQLLASLQLDYNPNLLVQTNDLGQVAGATMRSVIVGASSSRTSSLSLSEMQAADPSSVARQAPQAAQQVPPPVAALAPEGSAAEFASSTAAPLSPAGPSNANTLASDDAYAYLYSGISANSSQSFVGCIYGLNISADNAEWWQAPNEERNVERGCSVVDPCESNSCPVNSRCQRIGLNQRKCLCNPGFVGDLCVPVCELQLCRGENSRCVPSSSTGLAHLARGGATGGDLAMTSSTFTTSDLAPHTQEYTCECEPQLSGRNCEHQLSAKCPANWWGRPVGAGGNSSICGPCNCDESRGFDGDCDKLTGQCLCKPNHYQPPDSDQCLACDCYLVGSLGTSCNQTSGQCKCRPGVVGRRCDSCASQFAEVTLRGCEVIYDACPKTYSDGIWWDKAQLGELAVQQCPPTTSTGRATRFCHKLQGWQPANLFDCISNTFSDLLTQFKFLEDNKYQMSSQLAMKIASNLRQALNETISSAHAASTPQLYGSDMYISFRLVHHLIQHESQQRGLNLTHRQDRAYVRNLAESVSYLLDPAYADNWPEIATRSPNGGPEYLLKLMDTYGRVLIESQSDTFTQPFEVNTKHLTFGMDTLALEQLYDPSKWSFGEPQLPAGLAASSSASNPVTSNAGHFPSSPPYATDPFELSTSNTYGPGGRLGLEPPAHSTASGAPFWQPDGTSIYLDFSVTRDASPSVMIPKYDNYHATSDPESNVLMRDQLPQTRALVPLRVLRMRAPRELAPTAGAALSWLGAARSRARRQAFTIADYSQPMGARSGLAAGQQLVQRPPIVVYSIYKTLGPLLPSNYDSTVQNRLGILAKANSPIVWLTVRPHNSSEFLVRGLQPKITYTLRMLEPLGKTRPQCAIWDFTSGPSVASAPSALGANATSLAASTSSYGIKQTGRFTTRGCELKGVYPGNRLRHRYDYVNCSCDHLGAVVVLMDSAGAAGGASGASYDYLGGAGDGEPTSFRELALALALGISLLILCATLFVLACIRGHSIKSNSNSINKNLIVILALIESLILYSILSRYSLNQREYQCKLIAIFLHYFTIALFHWLLVNAIHFYRMLTELRDINHGPMRFYHVLGYAVPAFFVALAVGLRMEQFGNYLFCWLSIHEPIIWSMFGPICFVSSLILLLLIMALCKSLPLDKMLGADHDDQHAAELIKSHMLINVIKTPLIGVYSIMAVYAVNEALESAYLFPLIVVIKSLVLFALLCLIDKYIRYNMYVSWLRLKGEKVPVSFGADEDGIRRTGGGQLYYAGHAGAYNATMMGSAELAGYGGLKGPGAGAGAGAAGQLLFPMTGGGQHGHGHGPAHATPGFQSSCTDIFRPELLAGLSAASTTSRSSVSDDDLSVSRSSSATSAHGWNGEYRRHAHHHHHHPHPHPHHHRHRADDLDEPDADYGRTGRRHRRRAHGAAKKAHRKHRHHGSHHHSHGHYHHHRHRSSHADPEAASYELESSTADGSHGRHHHRTHRHDEPAAEGHYHHGRQRHRRHHHHQASRHHDDDDESERAPNESERRGPAGSGTNSLEQILRDDDHGLLASSHSSDNQDDIGRSPSQQQTTGELGQEQQQQQTVPMELVQTTSAGAGGEQPARNTEKAKDSLTGDE